MTAEAKWDKKLKIHTCGRDESKADRFHYPYEPTPYAVLERIAQSGLIGRGSRVVDYGCGMGRVGLYLSTRLGCHVTGVDCNPAMVERALQNAKSCAGAPKVAFHCRLAQHHLPQGEDCFYFFNPFSAEILAPVLERILADPCAKEPLLLFYYPNGEYRRLLEEHPRLRSCGSLDCRDLFSADDPRETVLIYRAVPLE